MLSLTAKLYRFKLAAALFGAGGRCHLWPAAATITRAVAPLRICACAAKLPIKDAVGRNAAGSGAVSIQTLDVLENAAEVYRRVGHFITFRHN